MSGGASQTIDKVEKNNQTLRQVLNFKFQGVPMILGVEGYITYNQGRLARCWAEKMDFDKPNPLLFSQLPKKLYDAYSQYYVDFVQPQDFDTSDLLPQFATLKSVYLHLQEVILVPNVVGEFKEAAEALLKQLGGKTYAFYEGCSNGAYVAAPPFSCFQATDRPPTPHPMKPKSVHFADDRPDSLDTAESASVGSVSPRTAAASAPRTSALWIARACTTFGKWFSNLWKRATQCFHSAKQAQPSGASRKIAISADNAKNIGTIPAPRSQHRNVQVCTVLDTMTVAFMAGRPMRRRTPTGVTPALPGIN